MTLPQARRLRPDRTRASPHRNRGTGRAYSPAGQVQRARPGGPLHDDQGAGREPAAVAQRGEHPLHLLVRRGVGRVGEHDVARRVLAGPAGQHPLDPVGRAAARPAAAAPRCCPGSPGPPGRPTRPAARPPRPRDSASRPTAPEPAYRSSTRGPVQRAADRQDGAEQPLAGPVRRRPGVPARGHRQPPAARRSGDDAGHRLAQAFSRYSACSRSSSTRTASASAGCPASAGSAVDQVRWPRRGPGRSGPRPRAA